MNKIDQLRELKEMFDQGLITSEEFDASKQRVLASDTPHEQIPKKQQVSSNLLFDNLSDPQREKLIKRYKTSIKVYRVMLIVFSVIIGLFALGYAILLTISDSWGLISFEDIGKFFLWVTIFVGFDLFMMNASKYTLKRLESTTDQL